MSGRPRTGARSAGRRAGGRSPWRRRAVAGLGRLRRRLRMRGAQRAAELPRTATRARSSCPWPASAASNPSQRLGSLVVNFGGPGDATAETLRAGAAPSSRVHDRYDIVGLDPRGTGGDGRHHLRREHRGGRPGRAALHDAGEPRPRCLLARLNAYNAPCVARTRGSCRTPTPPTRRATSTACAARSARRARTTSASPTGRSSARPTQPFPHRRPLVLDGALDADRYSTTRFSDPRADRAFEHRARPLPPGLRRPPGRLPRLRRRRPVAGLRRARRASTDAAPRRRRPTRGPSTATTSCWRRSSPCTPSWTGRCWRRRWHAAAGDGTLVRCSPTRLRPRPGRELRPDHPSVLRSRDRAAVPGRHRALPEDGAEDFEPLRPLLVQQRVLRPRPGPLARAARGARSTGRTSARSARRRRSSSARLRPGDAVQGATRRGRARQRAPADDARRRPTAYFGNSACIDAAVDAYLAERRRPRARARLPPGRAVRAAPGGGDATPGGRGAARAAAARREPRLPIAR